MKVFVAKDNEKDDYTVVNAVSLELMQYGYVLEEKLRDRIARSSQRNEICTNLLKSYTLGQLNPPLFQNWEDREYFSFPEVLVQIMGYVLQVSGNDLYDPSYLSNLKSKINFKKFKTIRLEDSDKSRERFLDLVNSSVPLNRSQFRNLVSLSRTFYLDAPSYIKSDEARTAVLMGLSKDVGLLNAMRYLKCKSSDVMRFSVEDLEQVKLPADVKYRSLSWSERKDLVSFLNGFETKNLCEDMSQNRRCWSKFFTHTHILGQKGFKKFENATLSTFLSKGSRLDSATSNLKTLLKKNKELYDVTKSGNVAYRNFASRVQTAVKNKDFDSFKEEILTRPSYLLRNIGALSDICTRKTESQFVDLCRECIKSANASVLFSLEQIDISADYRIIDSKGNTTVTEADYHPVIGEVQGEVRREIYKRWGFPGQVKVAPKIKNRLVPFLSTNSELDRGSRIPFKNNKYLYFLLHWVQNKRRTDLDHSYVAFDNNWNSEVIYFGNQANSYMKQSGDITDAPPPNGATEYGRIDLNKVPSNIRYIAPIINVYEGSSFDVDDVYAGFMFSDNDRFDLNQDHIRYDLNQPAYCNIPCVIDIKKREIVLLDFNNRIKRGLTAHSDINDLKKIISAVETKKFMTVERFAALLSGDKDEVSLEIKSKSGENKIGIDDLHTLINNQPALGI